MRRTGLCVLGALALSVTSLGCAPAGRPGRLWLMVGIDVRHSAEPSPASRAFSQPGPATNSVP